MSTYATAVGISVFSDGYIVWWQKRVGLCYLLLSTLVSTMNTIHVSRSLVLISLCICFYIDRIAIFTESY